MSLFAFSSVTRIADLVPGRFALTERPRGTWRSGDYVCGQVLAECGRLRTVERRNGRMMEVVEGDRVIGALGTRAATLEAVGSWQDIAAGRFEALTSGGLFGATTSVSPFLKPLMTLNYLGHVTIDGQVQTMRGCRQPCAAAELDVPVVLIVGTSMSAGKTMAGRVIVHLLNEMGQRVVGMKLTGAARYRDVLSFGDAGAAAVLDFVDAGLPSTVCDQPTYREALDYLMSRAMAHRPDVIVAEAGASPLEPYNGSVAMELLEPHLKFELLCALDPYAVVGVQSAFARKPDLVAGGAANTSAGIELVAKLTGLPALNLLDSATHDELQRRLSQALAL